MPEPPTGLRARFEEHLDACRLLDGASRAVVACSGGGDSSALLVLLEPWAKKRGLVLVPTHVAHGLRGAEGRLDARAAADLAGRLGLPFALRTLDVAELRGKGESLEAACRKFRYESLLALASELGEATPVLTGHTLDDQAETVLLNLFRHAGRTRGGIRERRLDGVLRPLLPFRRAELRALLREEGVPWREDSTNEDLSRLRNRIRSEVLPALEARSPGTAGRLCRAAVAWTTCLDEVDARVDAAMARGPYPVDGPWPRTVLVDLGSPAAARLLLRSLGRTGRVPGRAQVRRVVERLLGTETRFSEQLGGLRLVADGGAISIERPAKLSG